MSMIPKFFSASIVLTSFLIITTAVPGFGQNENPSKLSFQLDVGYAFPFGDIDLSRGDRKTVTHEISSSLGLSTGIRYAFKPGKYLFFEVEYSSFEYTSTEAFFNGMVFTESDDWLNLGVTAGLGWRLLVKENSSAFLQAGVGYVFHNSTLTDFPSERILPADLSTLNVTTIDWDLFNRPGISIGAGYDFKLSPQLAVGIHSSFLISLIEGDIVDSPTSNDFDTKPNMSRGYWVANFGAGLEYFF